MTISEHLEIEVKFTIGSLEDLTRLEKVLGDPERDLHLMNRYWLAGSPDQGMVRLREQGGATEATVKTRVDRPEAPGVFAHRERNQRLTEDETLAALQGDSLEKLALVREAGLKGPFTYVGSIYCHRTVHPLGDLMLELDRIQFPDGTWEYELEVEHPEPEHAGELIAKLAREAGIVLVAGTRSKFKRLLQRSTPDPRGADRQ